MKHYRFMRGIFAEWFVIIYLTLTFHRILSWRYLHPAGEIDIIARKGAVLLFVEVKTRHREEFLKDSITKQQQQRISRSAEFYIASHQELQHLKPRFDAAYVHGWWGLRYVRGAW